MFLLTRLDCIIILVFNAFYLILAKRFINLRSSKEHESEEKIILLMLMYAINVPK